MNSTASAYRYYSQCPETLSGDADIAGIGVLLSFGLSGFLTTAAALIASALYNDIPIPFIRIADARKRKFWLHVLDRIVLGLSDQQLMTGFCILLIGYLKLHWDISVYHISCVINLAMFSSSAHLASAISLRRYFQNNPEVAWIRVVLMSTFALLLAVSLIIFGPGPVVDGSEPGLPGMTMMTCSALSFTIFTTEFRISKVIGILLTVYLAICYWAAYSYVFPNAEVLFTKWLYTKPLELIERLFELHQFHERFRHRRYKFALPLAHGLQFAWWAVSFVLTMLTRYWGAENFARFQEGDERGWGFGQLLALLLILLPLLSGVEIFYEERRMMKRDSQNVDDAPLEPVTN